MDINPNTIPTGWAAVGATVLIIATVLWAALSRKWRRTDAETKERREHYNAYVAAWHEWQDYIDAGEAAAASKVLVEIKEMEAKKWHIAPVLAVCILLICGCHTKPPAAVPEPVVETVLLTEHVRIVSPGDTVPEYPAGEHILYLVTPTGMKHLLPASAPINRLKEEPGDACD